MIEFVIWAVVLTIDFAYALMLVSINMPQEKPVIRKLPKVSVIIAAKDGSSIRDTIMKLKRVKRPKLEIIVVSSDAKTLKIARKYANKTVKDAGIGKGPALNAAVKKASCKILYFLDEDSIVKKDTVEKVCSGLNGNEIASGSSMPHNKGGYISSVARLYFSLTIKIQSGLYKLTGATFVPGRNFAIYKNTLKKVGGFRNALTEDLDLTFRLYSMNKKARFVNASTMEQVPSKLSWYIKQQQRWNVGCERVMMEWEKRIHAHDIIIFTFISLVGIVAPLSLLFLALGIVFGSYLFLSVTVLGFLICLSSVLTLDSDDIALFPVTFFAFIFVQTGSVIYSILKKPKGWYRTPKEDL